MLRAYRRSDYAAAGAVVRIGRRSAAADALLRSVRARQAAFIAAANPYSRRMPDGVNARRHRMLLQALGRVPYWPGAGSGRGWMEPHVLAVVAPGRAAMLGRRFRQRAIVLVGLGQPARLWMV